MSTFGLEKLFHAQSVAIVGASVRPSSVGAAALANIQKAGFSGQLFAVNPRHRTIGDLRCYPSLRALPTVPDVAVVATPAHAVPGVIADAAAVGVRCAVIFAAGLGQGPGSGTEQVARIARQASMRVIGPNCLGVLLPHLKLNASFAAAMPPAGDLALISQSGAIAAGLIDWAANRQIGFSAAISIGEQMDVDLGDLLDYCALDPGTRTILLYIEAVKDARKFMSAARAAARAKPVVAVKAGRHALAAKAAATHTGALAGSDAVYEAAFRRAGILRAPDLRELLAAAEALGRLSIPQGGRLAVLTNGGGIGVLAIDRLLDLKGKVADLSPDTRRALDQSLPATWSHANPVDIIGDADDARYTAALEALLADPANDAVLVINVQTALASAQDIAKATIDVVERQRKTVRRPKPVLASWIGAREAVLAPFAKARIPSYTTETGAIEGFMHLARRADALARLLQTPPSLTSQMAVDKTAAKAIIDRIIATGRKWASASEASELMRCYQIPSAPVIEARDPDEAAEKSAGLLELGPVAVKLLSRNITHKSDIGGVRLGATTPHEVRDAAAAIFRDVRKARPDAIIDGVILQPMVNRPGARELIAGIADDPTFGPVIAFGQGGTAVEVVNDKALALPPLDLALAHDLIDRTRIAKILRGYRNEPPAKLEDIAVLLVRLAQMAADFPEIREVDINPLLADSEGVIGIDCRVAVSGEIGGSAVPGHPRFAIRPYPAEWVRDVVLPSGLHALLRPVRPDDEPLFHEFFTHISVDDLRLRFFAPIKEFSHAFIARLTQIDYARAMAFIAIDAASDKMIGAVRVHADSLYRTAEYGVLVRSDLKGQGLGWELMQMMINYARAEGLSEIHGQILRENETMLRMCRNLGFDVTGDPQDPMICLARLPLAS